MFLPALVAGFFMAQRKFHIQLARFFIFGSNSFSCLAHAIFHFLEVQFYSGRETWPWNILSYNIIYHIIV